MPEKKLATKSQKWPKAIIGWKTYTLDSDNKLLLKLLKEARWDKELQKKVDVPYLPIEVIYQLLEQMYPWYGIESPSMEFDKEYSVKKSYFSKEAKKRIEKSQEVMLFRKTVTLILNKWERKLQGTAQWVATINQITVDQMLNGFDMKQEARAIKNACKKLWRVFRFTANLIMSIYIYNHNK